MLSMQLTGQMTEVVERGRIKLHHYQKEETGNGSDPLSTDKAENLALSTTCPTQVWPWQQDFLQSLEDRASSRLRVLEASRESADNSYQRSPESEEQIGALVYLQYEVHECRS